MIDHHGLCLGNPCSCADTNALPVVNKSVGSVSHIPLEYLSVSKPVPAGMNPYVVMALTYKFRSSSEDVAPIQVVEQVAGRGYRIIDGRHRYVASLMAGRSTVLAEVVEGP